MLRPYVLFPTRTGWTILACALALAPTAFSQTAKPTFRGLRDQIASTTATVVLARVGQTEVTNQVLRRWLEVGKPTHLNALSVDQILRSPAPLVKDVITTVALYEMAYQQSLRDADFVSTGLAEAIQQGRDRILSSRLVEKEVDEKNPPMTREEARRWYQEHIYYFTEPFTFTAQTIFLSTYRPYKLKKGDSLLQIATTVAGDPNAAPHILDPRTSEPVVSSKVELDAQTKKPVLAPTVEANFLPPAPPQEGQFVLVPMPAGQRLAVRQRMEKIESELKAGADFTSLAIARSEDPPELRGKELGPLPAPGRPLHQAVLDAVIQTPVGQVTSIVETPHGFVLLKVMQKTDQPVRPFDQEAEAIIEKEWKSRGQAAARDLAKALFKDPILKIDQEALVRDAAPNDLTIARAGDFRYTWGDFRRDTGRKYSDPPREERRDLLERSSTLRDALILAKARSAGLERDPQVIARSNALEMFYRGRAYREWYANNRVPVGPEPLRAFYDENRDMFRISGRYQVRELIHRLDDQEAGDEAKIKNWFLYLQRLAEKIGSERAFARDARTESNWPEEAGQRGELKWVEENYRGPQFGAKLATLEADKVHGPFRVDDDVLLIWVNRAPPRKYRGLEEARAEVDQLYRRVNWDALLAATDREIRSRSSLEFAFTVDDGGTTDSAKPATPTRSP